MQKYRDILFKAFWTAVAAAGGVTIQAVADLPAWWAPVLATALNAVLAYARQQVGEPPPVR